MRTVHLRDYVLFGAADLLNITPDPDLSPDLARQMCRHLNTYVKKGWKFWEFPDLTKTEERAFRTIWSGDKTFKRSNEDGAPDELFYIADMTYYQVNPAAAGDPPVGTLPTNVNYFLPLDPVDRYIPFDQKCRVAIDTVLGVYAGNPRINAGVRGLTFRPSERGIDVGIGGGTTAFLHYKIKPSQFTIEPYDNEKAYPEGGLSYWEGETYRALRPSKGYPPNSGVNWVVVPVPEVLADYLKYVIAGELADDAQNKSTFMEQAIDFLCDQADKLIGQGQQNFYNLAQKQAKILVPLGVSSFWWSVSPPFSGSDTVSTLTEVCDEAGVLTAPYIASFFNGGAVGAQALDIMTSLDGAVFKKLRQNAFIPADGNIRDPSITHAAGYWWVAYTAGNFGRVSYIGLAKSANLLDWTAAGVISTKEASPVFNNGVGNGTTTFVSATANFVAGDVGKSIFGGTIPAGTTIFSRTNATTVVLTAAVPAGTGITFQVDRVTQTWAPEWDKTDGTMRILVGISTNNFEAGGSMRQYQLRPTVEGDPAQGWGLPTLLTVDHPELNLYDSTPIYDYDDGTYYLIGTHGSGPSLFRSVNSQGSYVDLGFLVFGGVSFFPAEGMSVFKRGDSYRMVMIGRDTQSGLFYTDLINDGTYKNWTTPVLATTDIAINHGTVLALGDEV